MRSDHLNKHMKTHNPQTSKKIKEEKGKQSNGQSTNASNKLLEKVKVEKSDLSPVTAARLAAEERMMYNSNSVASIGDYQAPTPNLSVTTNGDLFLPHHAHHSFAPMLDNASSLPGNAMGFTMPYYS